MSFKNLFEKGKKILYEKFSEGGGNMLIFMGALGWFTAAVAQVVALNINKKIPKEEKGFLIKQEVADGAVNCGMYLCFTKLVQTFVNWGVEKGKITSDTIKPLVKKVAEDKNIDLVKYLEKKNISDLLKDQVEDLTKFKKFKNGVDIFTNLLASIFACNIVTPLARNFIAGKWVKKDNVKNEINPPPVEQTIITKPKLKNNSVGFNGNNYLNPYKSNIISPLGL